MTTWIRSSRCESGNCAEVTRTGSLMWLRSSLDPDVTAAFTAYQWGDFLREVTGEFVPSLVELTADGGAAVWPPLRTRDSVPGSVNPGRVGGVPVRRQGRRIRRGAGVGMSWEDFAICRSLPYDWWETGDEGNRLAMTLCRLACPVSEECAVGDPKPVGVVRAGVAYSQTGIAHTECPCGRPVIQPARVGWCRTCEPPEVRTVLTVVDRPKGRPGRPVLFPCGTWQAYQRHVRRGEPTDAECRAAHRVLHRQQDAARRQRRQAAEAVAA